MNLYFLNQAPPTTDYPYLYCGFAGNVIKRPISSLFRPSKMEYADISSFPQQVERHSTIYFSGGDTPTLLSHLGSCGDWIKYLYRKQIYAISAGISALMVRSYNVDHLQLVEGLGLLPFQSIVHFQPEMAWMIDQLKQYPLPVLLFDENPVTIAY